MSEKRRDNNGRILKTGESQRKDLTYMYRFTDESGARRYIYAPTLSELRAKEAELEANKAKGIAYDAKKIKVSELIEMHLQNKARKVRASTMYAYRRKVIRIQSDPIYDLLVTQVKVSTAKAYIGRLADSGLKYATVFNFKCFMGAVFKIAVEDNLILRNPFEFDLQDIISYEKTEKRGLTIGEQQQYLDFVSNHKIYKKYYDDTVVLLETGMRIGEYCALTKADIDFVNRRVRIDKQLRSQDTNKLEITPPKSASGIRYVPLSDDAIAALQRIMLRRKAVKIEPMINGVAGFINLTTWGSVKNQHNFEWQFKKIRFAFNEEYGTDLNITPHTFRHTYCTNLVRAGIDLKSLQYLMGHAKADMTINTYTHFSYEDAEAAYKKVRSTV